ncbi:hypothetical protein GGR57DRAFT_317207 [Xylariaceae sp. FL1272]|nr:hypothetical protein GGR57DRAFT_317207 [Xylariaceae sp. FL1272]
MPDSKDTLCRNVLIYGHCRYENQGCAFRHDQNKPSNDDNPPKKSLNVDSPSFTPAQPGRKSNLSTNATPFTPRGSAAQVPTAATLQQDGGTNLFKSAAFTDFTQNHYNLDSSSGLNGTADSSLGFDPFMSSVTQTLPSTPYNPYADDHNALAAAGASYYAPQSAYAPTQPLQHHLYYPGLANAREQLQPYQRFLFDFFLPEDLRETMQKKADAARQVLPGHVQANSLAQYHSLVPLVAHEESSTGKHRSTQSIFGLPTWAWKATSRKDGNVYFLRRIEGFRLTNEDAIKAVQSWKKINHPGIVTVVEAFTTREFSEPSLIFAHAYHPLSKTLAEHHFPATPNNRFGRPPPAVPESTLWSYLVQLSSALLAIHKAKLAARCIDITKVVLTDKNKIRLSGCSILDVMHFDAQAGRRIEDIQQEDFYSLGKLLLSVATKTLPKNMKDYNVLVEQLGHAGYSQELKERITWLLTPPSAQFNKTAEQLVCDTALHMNDTLVSFSVAQDEAFNHLGRELENGRVVRLMAKLGTINERPEFEGELNWSENGERYPLKLFRDYVFHQVDAQGHPVLDLGHIISCFNKLDTGTDEKVYLVSRDQQTAMVMTYKELHNHVKNAFGDLQKASNKQQAQNNRAY